MRDDRYAESSNGSSRKAPSGDAGPPAEPELPGSEHSPPAPPSRPRKRMVVRWSVVLPVMVVTWVTMFYLIYRAIQSGQL